MSNIFSNVKRYAGKWEVVGNPQKLDDEDLAMLEPMATVVKSTWGKSLCFTVKSGGYNMYLVLDKDATQPVGTRVPITDIEVITLRKEGEDDIERVRIIEGPVI